MDEPNWWAVIGLAVDVLGVFLMGLFEMTLGSASEDHLGAAIDSQETWGSSGGTSSQLSAGPSSPVAS